jgi:hypothetical protein
MTTAALVLPTEGQAERLPQLVALAGQRLLDACTSAEVLEAHEFAKKTLAFAKLIDATKKTMGDCLIIVKLAEIRLATEIDAGQASGVLAQHGGDHTSKVANSDLAPPSYAELGVKKQDVASWRETASLGEEGVRKVVQDALNAGKTPSDAMVKKAAKAAKAATMPKQKPRRKIPLERRRISNQALIAREWTHIKGAIENTLQLTPDAIDPVRRDKKKREFINDWIDRVADFWTDFRNAWRLGQQPAAADVAEDIEE